MAGRSGGQLLPSRNGASPNSKPEARQLLERARDILQNLEERKGLSPVEQGRLVLRAIPQKSGTFSKTLDSRILYNSVHRLL